MGLLLSLGQLPEKENGSAGSAQWTTHWPTTTLLMPWPSD
jgi:hypothetical protein